MRSLTKKVEQYFIARKFHKANPVKQFLKLFEDAGDLFEGVNSQNGDLIRSANGKMQVDLIGLELQINKAACIEATPEEKELLLMVACLGNLATKLHKHVFQKESDVPHIVPDRMMLQSCIHSVAIHNCTSADSCLASVCEKMGEE
ncbi:TPA: hypothetical protein ACGO62_001104 [Streptococcus suis]